MDGPAAFAIATLLLGACCCLWSTLSGSSLRGYRRPYALALTINVLAVAIDGRFDSEGDLTKLPWPTLLSPAGWAFAIWGLIYMGEMAGLAVVLLNTDGSLERAGRASNAAWLAANCAQALWCAAFRPWAVDLLWLPTCAGASNPSYDSRGTIADALPPDLQLPRSGPASAQPAARDRGALPLRGAAAAARGGRAGAAAARGARGARVAALAAPGLAARRGTRQVRRAVGTRTHASPPGVHTDE